MQRYEKLALNSKKALIRIDDIDVATLSMIATDEYQFVYLTSYLTRIPQPPPVSLTLPLRSEPYLTEGCLPAFFDNLLFEGEQLRLAEKKFGLNRRSVVDRFKLLMLTGNQTLSFVKILPIVDNKPLVMEEADYSGRLITCFPLLGAYVGSCSYCLKRHPSGNHARCQRALWDTQRKIQIEAFTENPINIFRTIVLGQSISGAQRKATFRLDQNKILRRHGFPQYIIKPEGDYPEMPANEHLTMAIAREIGFHVPPMGLFWVENIGYVYVIKRFDWDAKTWFHPAEDMAQLSGELAENKDQSTMEEVAMTIKKYVNRRFH